MFISEQIFMYEQWMRDDHTDIMLIFAKLSSNIQVSLNENQLCVEILTCPGYMANCVITVRYVWCFMYITCVEHIY